MAYAAPSPRYPAPPVVVEAPESVGLLLWGYAKTNDTTRFNMLLQALDAAAYAAARELERSFTIRSVVPHLEVESDPSQPRPHAHLLVADQVDRTHLNGLAHMAHASYQNTLQDRLKAMRLGIIPWPSPNGWEIAGTTDNLGVVDRRPCGPGLYPLDTYAEPHRRIS